MKDKGVSCLQMVFKIKDYKKNTARKLGELPSGVKFDSCCCSTDSNQNTSIIKGSIDIKDGIMYFTGIIKNKINFFNIVTAYISFVPE